MKTIKTDSISILEIKKSKFIGYTFFCESVENANIYLRHLRLEHKKATHICYAYVINSNEKASDDGEPQGTAGIPILDTIKKQKLENVMCVVVRYFGGIKLGAGGLVRAYCESASNCLSVSETSEMLHVTQFEIVLNYGQENVLNSLKSNVDIYEIEVNYLDKIIVSFCATETVVTPYKEYNLKEKTKKLIRI